MNPIEIDIEELDLDSKSLIGQGSFAKTYKVFFKNKSTVCALKRSHDHLVTNVTEDLKKEIAILNHIEHDNIIGLFGIVYWKTHLCLVMEYATDRSVYDHLHGSQKDRQFLTKEFKEKIIKDVCHGLDHLHGMSKPIRHGDVKSPNVLLCLIADEILAKIADFGLSDELTTTRTGDGKCSYRWAAPEIFAATLQGPKTLPKSIKTVKSDVWSLGALAWELWMERLPYNNDTSSTGHELMLQICFHVGQKKWRPYDANADLMVPDFYRSFLMKCFEFDYKKRWSSSEAYYYLDMAPSATNSSDMEEMDVDPESVRTNADIPIEIRNQYTQSLVLFTDALRDPELFHTVKNLFRVEIPKGAMERIKTPHDLVDRLEQQALLSIWNTSILETRLKMIEKDGERLASFFRGPSTARQRLKGSSPEASVGRSAEIVEAEKTETAASNAAEAAVEDGSMKLAQIAMREIERPLRRTLEDKDSPLDKLLSDWICRESKRGLKKLQRFESKDK